MEEINSLFLAQTKNRWSISQSSHHDRRKKLLKLKKVIQESREEIKAALYADFKKPYAETELAEIHTSLDEINFAVKNLKKWMRIKKVPSPITLIGSKSYLKYEAKGVVLVLAPWNYPFCLLINPVVAAISAGNCVIARPSEKTPATGKIIKKIIEQVFSSNEVAIALGDVDVAEALLDLPFDHIFFTGSTNVGKKVMEKAAKHLTPVTLELGGKSPVIIDKDVNLQSVVERIAWGKFLNAGQTCVAPDYVFLPEALKADFIEAFKKQIFKLYGETSNERFNTKDFARIIDDSAFKRLNAKIQNERSILEDKTLAEDRFIPPTLLIDVTPESPIMQDEIFGPILPLMTYKNLDTVIEYIQKNPKPLALYLFTNNKKIIKRVLKETTSGGIAVNQVVLQLANPYLPFGGVGHSGMGSYHGEFGFKTFSHERSLLKQGRFDLSACYFPPYSTFPSKLAFKLLDWLE